MVEELGDIAHASTVWCLHELSEMSNDITSNVLE